jgi:hypothetical protein
MSTTTSKPRSADAKQIAPPDERFWKRYSAHGEFPLSSVSSVALHVLLGGVLILGAMFIWAPKPPPTIKTEAVRITGGGGGPKDGKTPGPGRNPNESGEEAPDEAKPEKPSSPEEPTPSLSKIDIAKEVPKEMMTPDTTRRIAEGVNLAHFKDINTKAGQQLRKGLREEAGSGQGGPGRDGGKDKGRDKGEGDREGPGKSAEMKNEREKFLERCDMKFVTTGPDDYFRQLDALGAIIAIPTQDDSGYVVIHYPKGFKPVKDVAELNRVYWKDYRPDSVANMMRTLRRPEHPSHFVAFMPEALEDQLKDMEKKRAESHGKAVKDILKTTFRVIKRGSKYVVELENQTYF